MNLLRLGSLFGWLTVGWYRRWTLNWCKRLTWDRNGCLAFSWGGWLLLRRN